MVIQMTIFESIIGLLTPRPIFFAGFGVLGLALFFLFRKHPELPKLRIIFGSVLLYYYLCIVFRNIVGIPSLREFSRLLYWGESLFNPIITLTPFVNEHPLEFILNVFLFIPLGFLCPLISQAHRHLKKMVFLGFGLSLTIEISQMFTRHRVSDINDLIANTIGALLGYLCFALLAKLHRRKHPVGRDLSRFLPLFIIILAYIFAFFA